MQRRPPARTNRQAPAPAQGASASRPSAEGLRLALPSDGELHEPTLSFLRDCGLPVRRPNARRYSGSIPALPGVEVLFQRTADITQKVEEGSAELGITGLDRALEYRNDDTTVAIIMEDLRYGRCDFVLAVPEDWLDVTSVADLADLALEFHGRGQQLRIATKYPKLLRRYLFRRGINYFTLVAVSGALEAAPSAGYADLIADLTASGATLRENRLKTLEGGIILSSQACIIANRPRLAGMPEALELARRLLELVEARLRAEPYYRLTANVRGASPENVSATILARPDLSGLRGPTVARVYNTAEEDWFGVSLVVKKDRLMDVVTHLRDCGGVDIAATQVSYLFGGASEAFGLLICPTGAEKGRGSGPSAPAPLMGEGRGEGGTPGKETPPSPPLQRGATGDFPERNA